MPWIDETGKAQFGPRQNPVAEFPDAADCERTVLSGPLDFLRGEVRKQNWIPGLISARTTGDIG
jgi:hypothetical protein